MLKFVKVLSNKVFTLVTIDKFVYLLVLYCYM